MKVAIRCDEWFPVYSIAKELTGYDREIELDEGEIEYMIGIQTAFNDLQRQLYELWGPMQGTWK